MYARAEIVRSDGHYWGINLEIPNCTCMVDGLNRLAAFRQGMALISTFDLRVESINAHKNPELVYVSIDDVNAWKYYFNTFLKGGKS